MNIYEYIYNIYSDCRNFNEFQIEISKLSIERTNRYGGFYRR